MNNKMYRKLVDLRTGGKEVTWVNRRAKAQINFTEEEFEFLRKELRRKDKTKILKSGVQSGYVHSFLNTSKMTEIKLEYNITTHISYNESRGSFPLLPDVLRNFDSRDQSELPQVIIISEYAC